MIGVRVRRPGWHACGSLVGSLPARNVLKVALHAQRAGITT